MNARRDRPLLGSRVARALAIALVVAALSVLRPGLPSLPDSLTRPVTVEQFEELLVFLGWLALIVLLLLAVIRLARTYGNAAAVTPLADARRRRPTGSKARSLRERASVDLAPVYEWERRVPSDRALTDAWLTERIRQIYKAHRKVYGAPRIHADLRMAYGVRVSRKRVERLMREAGISGLVRRKRGRTTVSVPGVRVADDLVERQFRPDAPNVLWIADVERHEALFDRAVVKGHRGPFVAAGGCKLGAA